MGMHEYNSNDKKSKSREKYLSGKKVEPIEISENMSVKDLVKTYDGMGYNAKRLAEACHLFKKMLDENTTICLTLSGAMTPVGVGGAITELIKRGFIDWIISTGANIYHDIHLALDFEMRQGHFNVDDEDLYDKGWIKHSPPSMPSAKKISENW